MATTSDFVTGMKLSIDGEIFTIIEFLHVKLGRRGAFVRTKLKNIRTGKVIEKTFRAGERVDEVRLDKKPMQYLYASGDQYFFMDTDTYEQIPLDESLIGDSMRFLKEGDVTDVLFQGNTPIGIELPIFVNLKVTKTDPGVRGDTVSGGSKPATLETGAVIQVPLFIQEGDVIKVDTRTGEYVERIK